MKKIILLCLSLSSLLNLTSCDKQLFQDPITSKELGNFLQNEIEVEEYVNATYAKLQANGLYGLYFPAFSEIQSDVTYDEVPANDGVHMDKSISSPSFQPTIWSRWFGGIPIRPFNEPTLY